MSDALQQSAEITERCTNKGKRLQQQFYANSRIQEHAGFEELDIAGLQRGIHKVLEQINALTKENKALTQLKKQLEDTRERKETAQLSQDQLVREEGVINQKLESITQQLEGLKLIVDQITHEEKDLLLQFQQQQSEFMSQISLENLEAQFTAFRDARQAGLEKLKGSLQKPKPG